MTVVTHRPEPDQPRAGAVDPVPSLVGGPAAPGFTAFGATPGAPTALTETTSATTSDASAALLSCLRMALHASDWRAGSAEVVADMAHRLGCLRVSLGWVVAGQLRMIALSDGVVLEEGAAIPELQQAMLECLHQQSTLVWPPQSRHAMQITLAHQSLFKAQGLAGVASVPIAHRGRAVGVLTCERSVVSDPLRPNPNRRVAREAFTAEELRWVEQLTEGLAPLMVLRQRLDRSLAERMRSTLLVFFLRLRDPQERRLRWSMALAVVTLLVGLLWPVPYHVSATARLEGAVQRVMSAGQDGFLREVHVRPGDVVKAGQLLAELSDDDLQNARRARQAEVTQQENTFAEAFARGDRSQAAVAQTKVAEARAQLALVEQQLQRLRMVAPFDGVVIQGDLHQQLGAPVKRGEALLTLAPGLDWRVVLEVDESDVGELQAGQAAGLRLAAIPGQVISLVLDRVTPVAKSTADGVRYEVEATPTGAGAGLAGLRPGLQGVAQVQLPSRPLLLRWLDRAWRWVRLTTWTWF
jgi:Barrel-sandwich domain of CusB or HlyD membrane-fusion/GAF domain